MCIFSYNSGEVSFVICILFELIENWELGIGVVLWFCVEEKVEEMCNWMILVGLDGVGFII